LSRRVAVALGQFFGGLQHVIFNVQSRSHASDAIASLHQSQFLPWHIQPAGLATMAFLERNPKDFDNADLLKLMFLNRPRKLKRGQS
jgi:hypothetical protein